jgi:hypothetical protein
MRRMELLDHLRHRLGKRFHRSVFLRPRAVVGLLLPVYSVVHSARCSGSRKRQPAPVVRS